MLFDENEEQLLRSVALQNAKAVLFARDRAERETLEARQRIASILECITDGFLALDKEWRFTFLNRKGEEILRSPPQTGESAIGKIFWEELPETLGTDIERNFRRAARDQTAANFEYYFPSQSRWFEIRVHPGPEGLSVYFHDVTERHHAERALRQSEERFRATFHQATVGMTLASLDGQFEQVNARFGELLGYTTDELLNRKLFDVTHPDDLPITREKLRLLLNGTVDEFAFEKRYLRKDGQTVWGLTSVTVLKDVVGQPAKLIGIIEEITLRKRAEEAVRESAQRLQFALAAGRLGDWAWDASTDLLTLGPGACSVFGLPENTSITWTELRNLLHPDDRERARAAVEESLANHAEYEIEYRVRRHGKTRWIAARGRGQYTETGAVKGMIGIVQDMTEKKESDEALWRLASVVESSDDAIISMDLEAMIMTWNHGAERTFGYTAAEAIGKSVTMLIPKGFEDEEPRIIKRLLGGEHIDHYETIRVRKDGTLLNVSLTVSPVYDSAGKIAGASKISRDITDRKRAEQALRAAQAELQRHAERLEEEVAERTARLRETIQELEAFSYSVSHDMRSPLRAMQGYSDALLEDYRGKLDQTAQEYLKRIRRAASRMDLLIQDVLAYSRVAKGDIHLHETNVGYIIQEVIQTYPALQPERATVEIVTDLPPVLGHEAYLTQIVSNLLTNAVKFIRPGTKPHVRIYAVTEGGMVRITFEDNGIGIAAEHQTEIFQIFGRVYSEKNYEGTGIGLAIVKKAAERMGGSVGVQSEPGAGSRFYVILKRAV